MDFEENYEINRTADYIHAQNFTKVALQFPDELLKDSIRVVRALREKLRALRKCDVDGDERLVEGKKGVGLYVMADTTFGSCCVDEVGAAHINAECVVHYGHTCLSPTSTLPAFFVFGKASINVAECAKKICAFSSSCKKRVLVLFGLEYTYAIHDLKESLIDEAAQFSTSSSKLDISCAGVLPSVVAPTKGHVKGVDNVCGCHEDGDAEEVHTSYSIGGLTWSLPQGQQIEDYLLFWIGPDNSAFANLVLTYNTCEIVRLILSIAKEGTEAVNMKSLLIL